MCLKKLKNDVAEILRVVDMMASNIHAVYASLLNLHTSLSDMNTTIGNRFDALEKKIDALNTKPPNPEEPPLPELLWDEKLTGIGVTLERPASARYRIIAAWTTQNGSWEDAPQWAKQYQLDTLGGDHHVFGRCLDKFNRPLNKTFVLSWPGGADSRTPEPDGWANLPLAGQNWNPENGRGPYEWQALNGDKLVGLGMPWNHHWSFFAVWVDNSNS